MMVSAPLSAAALLDVCDRGQGRAPAEQALLLLQAAHPDAAPTALAALSLGRRDALLLELRRQAFGETLACRVSCPSCNELLEFTASVGDLLLPDSASAGDAEFEICAGEVTATMRLPNSADLLAAGACADADSARRVLLQRCVARAEVAGDTLDISALSSGVLAALAQAVAARDPQAELLLALECPACGAGWQASLDIAGFLWQELEVSARRIWREIHLLARAYGWRENDILALSAARRQRYLDLIESD